MAVAESVSIGPLWPVVSVIGRRTAVRDRLWRTEDECCSGSGSMFVNVATIDAPAADDLAVAELWRSSVGRQPQS